MRKRGDSAREKAPGGAGATNAKQGKPVMNDLNIVIRCIDGAFHFRHAAMPSSSRRQER